MVFFAVACSELGQELAVVPDRFISKTYNGVLGRRGNGIPELLCDDGTATNAAVALFVVNPAPELRTITVSTGTCEAPALRDAVLSVFKSEGKGGEVDN